MSVSQMIWSLDDQKQLPTADLLNEKELEDLLFQHIEILDPDWLLIGRQVRTDTGKYIDLLCMDHDEEMVVVELKKDLTPREVTAQVIEYASCVADMKPEKFAEIYLQTSGGHITLNQAYQDKFGEALNEENINQNVKMIIVAAKMDDSTERIIRYLRDNYKVDINILFFNVFAYKEHRFISRAWFEEDIEEQLPVPKSERSWNQEYYVSFGSGERRWEDAKKYGFISGGGGAFYSNTLKFLKPGDRIWVNIPRVGYVGVGIVRQEMQMAKDIRFVVDGETFGFADIDTVGKYLGGEDDPVKAEYVVQVNWIKSVSETQAVKEIGFFGNQNTVCRPRDQKWVYTVERLKSIWGIVD